MKRAFFSAVKSARTATLFLVSACASTGRPSSVDTSEASPLRIHTVTASPAGILVNAYLVEGKTGVVAVDSALTVSDAKQLRSKLDSLGKPLLAVLLTHGHPDHYNGVAELVRGRPNVPVYATADVAKVIHDYDAAKEAQWKPTFGAEWPAPRAFPNEEVHDRETIRLDGLRWTVRSLGPGESHADSYWTAEADQRYVFLGDVVLHGVHAYVSDGHTTEWLGNLRRLKTELAGVKLLYPGHGAAGGVELFNWQTRYLETYRAEVDRLRRGGTSLSEADKASLTTTMKDKYPDAALDFLVGLGADAVAAELARGQ